MVRYTRHRLLPVACTALLTAISVCTATNYYVETTGYFTNDGLSPATAVSDIPRAILYATDGDMINVGVGCFTDLWISVNKDLTIVGSDTYNAGNPPLSRHTSRTFVWYHPSTSVLQSSLMEIQTNNVTVSNITFNGNFISNVAAGIFTDKGNITVEYCTFENFRNDAGAYGILCHGTNDCPTPDSLFSHLNYNLFKNIIHSNASGIYLDRAPAVCANNEFMAITGETAQGGIYMERCFLTNTTSLRLSIDSNYFNNCTQAIWANNFGETNQPIDIRDNIITNCLVGIRVTSADAQAVIGNNTITVGGAAPTLKMTPARGIWIQADSDPWNAAPTDHQVLNNTIRDHSGNTGTVGVLLEYDCNTWTNVNNGVLASVYSNIVSDFDIGTYVEAGIEDIGNSNSPLVGVTIEDNEFIDSVTWAIQAIGMTNPVITDNNWFGVYTDPSNVIDGNVSISNWISEGSKYLDTDGDGTNDFYDADDDNDSILDTNEVDIGTFADRYDSDYDGQNDWEEYKVTGTDPTNRSSIFQFLLDPTNTPPLFSFTWQSVTDRVYAIYRTTNITDGFGVPLSNNIAATPPTNSYTDITATNSIYYYYRITVTNTVP